MISTVTPSTVSSVLSAARLFGPTHLLSVVAAVTFLVLLIEKEIVGREGNEASRWLSRGVNLGLVPLGITFVVFVGVTLLQLG